MTEQLENNSFSIKIFVPDGDPDGLRIVRKDIWPGVGVVFNRTNYKEAVRHRIAGKYFDRAGVYVLVGPPAEGSNLLRIYVGEADPIKDRLNTHYYDTNPREDFWEWVVFFVSDADDGLNKAHVQYLESRLLCLVEDAKQCAPVNKQKAYPPTLGEADKAYLEHFLSNMLDIFPILKLGVFEKTETTKKPGGLLTVELLVIAAKDINASGYEDAKGFVVVKGSQLVKEETNTIQQYMSTLRKDLLAQRVIVDKGQHYEFIQDQVFNSPSSAAGVILGAAANGRIMWKNKDGKTLKQLQEQAVGRQNHTEVSTNGGDEEHLSAIDAAAKVLGETGKPMTCKELIVAMAAKGYWTSPSGKTPWATLYAAILHEMEVKGSEARFTKAGPGLFALASTER